MKLSEIKPESLSELSRNSCPESPGMGVRNARNFPVIWKVRKIKQPVGFDENRRNRFADAIKNRILRIRKDGSGIKDPDYINSRLKKLANLLAVLDGRDSAEFIIEIMALPGKWDEWIGINTIETLLFSGARLGADSTLKVLNPIIDKIISQNLRDHESSSFLQCCLCLLPFIEPISGGFTRIREIIALRQFHPHELRKILTAIGYSRHGKALDLLMELKRSSGDNFQSITEEWIDALGALDTPESRQVLLRFIESDIEQLNVEKNFKHRDYDILALRISEIAVKEITIKDHLFQLCSDQLSPITRLLIAKVISKFGTAEAMLLGLDLIHDHKNPPIPYEIVRGLESLFLEHRPYGNTVNVYDIVPRDAKEIKRRLFNMVLNDENRKRSAWELLGQIESWRTEYGRPRGEPRHPDIDSSDQWPPINLVF